MTVTYIYIYRSYPISHRFCACDTGIRNGVSSCIADVELPNSWRLQRSIHAGVPTNIGIHLVDAPNTICVDTVLGVYAGNSWFDLRQALIFTSLRVTLSDSVGISDSSRFQDNACKSPRAANCYSRGSLDRRSRPVSRRSWVDWLSRVH